MGGGFGGSVLALFRAGAPSRRAGAVARAGRVLRARLCCRRDLIQPLAVDRRLAYKNLRTGLIAGAIALIVFALAWVVGLVY